MMGMVGEQEQGRAPAAELIAIGGLWRYPLLPSWRQAA
jgi:hypothetical protein